MIARARAAARLMTRTAATCCPVASLFSMGSHLRIPRARLSPREVCALSLPPLHYHCNRKSTMYCKAKCREDDALYANEGEIIDESRWSVHAEREGERSAVTRRQRGRGDVERDDPDF